VGVLGDEVPERDLADDGARGHSGDWAHEARRTCVARGPLALCSIWNSTRSLPPS
jgi:hypothetical protein